MPNPASPGARWCCSEGIPQTQPSPPGAPTERKTHAATCVKTVDSNTQVGEESQPSMIHREVQTVWKLPELHDIVTRLSWTYSMHYTVEMPLYFSISTHRAHPFLQRTQWQGHKSGHEIWVALPTAAGSFWQLLFSSGMRLYPRSIRGSSGHWENTFYGAQWDAQFKALPASGTVVPNPLTSLHVTSSGDKSRTSYLSCFFLLAWRKWREALWLSFQLPKVICTKGLGWIGLLLLAYRIDACRVPSGTQIECLYNYRKTLMFL